MDETMKFYRARYSFFDDDWVNDGTRLVKHFISKGTVVALDHEPNLGLWEPLELSGVASVVSTEVCSDLQCKYCGSHRNKDGICYNCRRPN